MDGIRWDTLLDDSSEIHVVEQWLRDVDVDIELTSGRAKFDLIQRTLFECLQQFPKSKDIQNRCYQLLRDLLSRSAKSIGVHHQDNNYIKTIRESLSNWTAEEDIMFSCFQFLSTALTNHENGSYDITIPFEILETLSEIITLHCHSKKIQISGIKIFHHLLIQKITETKVLTDKTIQKITQHVIHNFRFMSDDVMIVELCCIVLNIIVVEIELDISPLLVDELIVLITEIFSSYYKKSEISSTCLVILEKIVLEKRHMLTFCSSEALLLQICDTIDILKEEEEESIKKQDGHIAHLIHGNGMRNNVSFIQNKELNKVCTSNADRNNIVETGSYNYRNISIIAAFNLINKALSDQQLLSFIMDNKTQLRYDFLFLLQNRLAYYIEDIPSYCNSRNFSSTLESILNLYLSGISSQLKNLLLDEINNGAKVNIGCDISGESYLIERRGSINNDDRFDSNNSSSYIDSDSGASINNVTDTSINNVTDTSINNVTDTSINSNKKSCDVVNVINDISLNNVASLNNDVSLSNDVSRSNDDSIECLIHEIDSETGSPIALNEKSINGTADRLLNGEKRQSNGSIFINNDNTIETCNDYENDTNLRRKNMDMSYNKNNPYLANSTESEEHSISKAESDHQTNLIIEVARLSQNQTAVAMERSDIMFKLLKDATKKVEVCSN